MSHDCTRAIIDLDAVSSNFDAVCRKAKVPVMAVIKADAYGHGAVPVSQAHHDYRQGIQHISRLPDLFRHFSGLLMRNHYS